MISCPKCGYERRSNDVAPAEECPKCGVIYAKVSRPHQPMTQPARSGGGSRLGLVVVALVLVLGAAALGARVVTERKAEAAASAVLAAERQAQEAELKRRQEAEREQKGLERAVVDLERLYGRWKDASVLADSTARIALAGPVSSLQALRREVTEQIVPACLDGAKAALIEGMDAKIKGFVDFMQDANLGKIFARDAFQRASDAFEKYEFRLKSACPGVAVSKPAGG